MIITHCNFFNFKLLKLNFKKQLLIILCFFAKYPLGKQNLVECPCSIFFLYSFYPKEDS